MAVDKQLYLPTQAPFAPVANATLASSYEGSPLNGRDYTMGELVVGLPDSTFCSVQVFSPVQMWNNVGVPPENEENFDLKVSPLFFFEPRPFEPANSPVLAQRVLPFVYRDYERKHPALRQPYEVTIIMQYVPKIKEVEALPDAKLRQRIYEDLAECEFSVIEGFEVAKYADPSYRIGDEMKKKLDKAIKNNLPFYEQGKV